MAEPGPERKRRRRRWPFFAVFVLAVLLAIGFFSREHLAAWAAITTLKLKYGVSSRLAINRLDSNQAEIGSVSIGGGSELEASDINLQFRPMAMTVQRIEIGRVEIKARYDGQ